MHPTVKDLRVLQTPFYQFHLDHGAKMVDFAGWQMPMMYGSIHEEHKQVRTCGGLFDVSHMGRIKLGGRHARQLLERVLTRRVSDMKEHACRYSLVCNEQGGVLDDVIVYRFEYHWLLVVNASNREKILKHLNAHIGDWAVKIEDQTESTAMVALQGPTVMEQIGRFSTEVPGLARYHFCIKNLMIMKMTISRTGYTGEDGVELILPAATANMAMKLLLRDGGSADDPETVGIKPAGLGARDTLRMEAAMPLYGHELDETIDPISAGLGFAVSLDKDGNEHGQAFIGQEALQKIADQGPTRQLVGLKLEGRRTARQGMNVCQGDDKVGQITSACLSPTLGYPIAMAYVDPQWLTVGDTATVKIGAQRVEAQVVKLPFYKRA